MNAKRITAMALATLAMWLTAAALTGLAFTTHAVRGLAVPAVLLFAAGAVLALAEGRDELARSPVRPRVWPPQDDPQAPPGPARIWRPARPGGMAS